MKFSIPLGAIETFWLIFDAPVYVDGANKIRTGF